MRGFKICILKYY